jgi:hypothetical protein
MRRQTRGYVACAAVYGSLLVAFATTMLVLVKTQPSIRDVHRDIRRLLRLLDVVCREEGVAYWAGDGTLLGAVRDGDLIPWDDDADVFVLRGSEAKLLASNDRIRARHGAQFRVVNDSLRFTAVGHEFPWVDVFIRRPVERDGVTRLELSGTSWPHSWLTTAELGAGVAYPIGSGSDAITVPGPDNPVPYLERTYGRDWRTPKKDHPHSWSGFAAGDLYRATLVGVPVAIVLLALMSCLAIQMSARASRT